MDHDRNGLSPGMRRIQLSTLVFSALIVAGVVCAVVAAFGPVRLLGLGAVVVGIIALNTERRKQRNSTGQSHS